MDLGAVKVWVEKQNYVLSLIWGTFSRKNGCVTQNVFLHYSWLPLACMIKRPHQREYRGPLKSFFLLVAILWSRAVTLDIIIILSDEVRKLTPAITSLVVLRSDLWQNSLESGKKESEDVSFIFFFSFFFLHLPLLCAPLLFIPLLALDQWSRKIDPTETGDVTELSNSQLKMVQFTSSATWCKWPSLQHARRRQTSCERHTRNQLCTLLCHIDMARYVNMSEETKHTHTHTHIYIYEHSSDHSDQGLWQGVETALLGQWLSGPSGMAGENTVCARAHVCP